MKNGEVEAGGVLWQFQVVVAISGCDLDPIEDPDLFPIKVPYLLRIALPSRISISVAM
jgi:hypothetical protein